MTLSCVRGKWLTPEEGEDMAVTWHIQYEVVSCLFFPPVKNHIGRKKLAVGDFS